MEKISIIGGGWRTEFWIKLIQKFSGKYEIGTIYCRNKERANKLQTQYNVNVQLDYKKIYSEKIDLAIVCVQRELNELLSEELASNNINVMCETPFNKDKIKHFDKIRVAEQYICQPRFEVYKKIIDSKVLGNVHTIKLSCCHDYHAVSVLRYLLNVGLVYPDKAQNINLNDDYEEMYFRYGKIDKKKVNHKRYVSYLSFGDKMAIYDFSEGQYFSPIRRHQIEIYGDKGQIIDDEGSFIEGEDVRKIKIEREFNGVKGDLFTLSLKSIYCNGKEIYKNPFEYMSLSEEEIAMAKILENNLNYFSNKKGGYSVEEADLDMKISEIIKGEKYES